MKYTHDHLQNFNRLSRDSLNASVFAVAARAAAIYFGNKQKKLPPVYFNIVFNKLADVNIEIPCSNYFIGMEGGQLIHNVLLFSKENTRFFSGVQRLTYDLALEADIVNLLVGPMARCKYVSIRDRTPLNQASFSRDSANLYGSAREIDQINDYLNCFSGNKAANLKAINDLFRKAWDFINQPAYWFAISELANYILGNDKDILECDEIINVLKTFIPSAKTNISHESLELLTA